MITPQNRIYLLLVFGIISMYFGTVKGDDSLEHGTNVVNFMFIYIIGNTISTYKNKIKFKTKYLVIAYLFLNLLIVVTYLLFAHSILSAVIMKLCYFYCSPILILNAIILFIIISRIHFYSAKVNLIASSAYSMYIIHHIPVILYGVIGPLTLLICPLDNVLLTLLCLTLITLCIMSASFVIDQLFKPLFGLITDKSVDKMPNISSTIKYANRL